MKKKKLLGKAVSLVLAAALTVTALPTTGMEVQAAEQVQTETETLETVETTEDESSQTKSEEKSEEAQNGEEEKASEDENEDEVKTNSEDESEEEETSQNEKQTEKEDEKEISGEDAKDVSAEGEYAGFMIDYDESSSDSGAVTFYFNSADATSVQVKGSWVSDWSNLLDLQKESDSSLWKITVPTSKIKKDAGCIEYGFIKNGDWAGDEFKSKIYRNPIAASNGDVTLYYYKTYESNPSSVTLKYKVEGTDSYTDVTMEKEGDIAYKAELTNLADGDYEYYFDVDGAVVKDTNNATTGKFSKVTYPDPDPEMKSPVVADGKVTFNYYGPTAKEVKLAGDMTDWGNGAKDMTYNKETGYWSITETISAGSYGYKFIVDNKWITDPLNKVFLSNGNSALLIEGLASIDKTEVTRDGAATELPKTLKLYTLDGSTLKDTEVPVTYALSDKSAAYKDHITMAEATEEVAATISLKETFPFTVRELTLVASDENDHTSTIPVNVVSEKFKYTIYYYDADHSVDESALWIWENGGAGGAEFAFTGTEQLTDGNTWMKAELDLSYIDFGFKPKSKGGPSTWTWQSSGDYGYKNPDKVKENTLYIVADDMKVYTELPEIAAKEKRYLIVEYKRNDGSAQNWCFYTWNNGFGNNFYPFKEVNGSWFATVPVKPGISSVSYCIERDEVAEDGTLIKNWAEKDGNDYTCAMPEDQTVVKIVMEEGRGITRTYPYNVGYELAPKDKTIHFYYRNNEKFLTGETDQYASVAVEINGKEYPMIFNEEDQRYTFDFDDLEPGTYKYRYVLKETAESEKTYELDRYNEKKVTETDVEYSVVEYGSFNPVVSASVYRDSMDYNDNNVLIVEIDAEKDDDIEGMEVAKVTADLSALGGSAEVEIEPELLELTIAVRQGVGAGEKTIPVTIYDQFQNEYTAETTVTVTERVKGDDFDWDEAVIYFAVTDRFFDGNTSNNANVDKSGPSSYHGGDFAGLTQKLDYLKELGVNTIWITPIVANDMEDGLQTDVDGIKSWGYHGYWASDFESLDSHLGTEAEFATLLDEAHNRGMKIMVDVVLNHSGYNQEEKFNSMIKDEDGNAIPMIRDDSQMVSGSDQKYSLSGLPDFLTENKEVRELLVEWQSNWISKYPIDYYRVDTVKHVDDTTWSAFKNALTKINPKFKMIGEWAGAGYATDTGMLRTGRMDSLLDFDFNGVATDFVAGKISATENFLNGRNTAIDNTATVGQFIGSHDEDGFAYNLVNEKKISEERAADLTKVAASLQITAKGQPVIYYGEEIGLTGANNYPYQTNRYDFDWSKVTDDNDMLTHYKKLLSIRNQYSEVFAKGSRNTISANDTDQYDVFARSYAGTTLYVGLNTAEAENTVTFTVPAGVYCDIYSGTYYNTDNDGTIAVTIPAAKDGGTVILVASEKGLNIDEIPAQIYTGSEIKLSSEALKVRNGVELLTAGKDYTVGYKNNINVGTATVTVKGKGNYTDQLTAEFEILPKNIGEADVTLTYTDKLVYNKKKAQTAAPKLKYGKITLKENRDYTVVYYNKADVERTNVLSSIKEEGSYVMVITAKENSNYTGSIEKDVIIANKTLINGASVKLSASSVSYKDCIEEKWPAVTELKVKGKVIESTRYDVEYDWNGSVGTATAIITMKEDDAEYMGSVSKTFKVTGESLSKVVSIDKSTINDVVYDKAAAKTDTGITQENPALKAKSEGVTLAEGKDYQVSYKNNKKAGKATIVFTGIGAYTGSLTTTFNIKVKELKEDDDKLVINCAAETVYTKSGSKPAITVSYDGVLLDASDYKVTYKNNNKVTDKAQAIITFRGNYKGTVTREYSVSKNTLADMTVTAKDVMYNKNPGKAFATPVVKDPEGKTLKAGTDYSKKYTYTYANATTVENNKTTVARAAGATVDAKDIVPAGTLIKVTVTEAQNGNYVGENFAVYRVMAGDIAKASIKIADKTYTGYAVTLMAEDFKQIKLNGVTYKVMEINGNQIKLSGTGSKAIEGGLEIVSYTNNVNKGTARITLKGTGNFGGTVTKTFSIKAKNAKNNWFNSLTSIFSR